MIDRQNINPRILNHSSVLLAPVVVVNDDQNNSDPLFSIYYVSSTTLSTLCTLLHRILTTMLFIGRPFKDGEKCGSER